MPTNNPLDALDELIDDFKGKQTVARPTPFSADRLKKIADLKKRINGETVADECHESDRHWDPAMLQEIVSILGDVAVHGRMFRRDQLDNHERTPDEVRQTVAGVCRKRGTDATFEMVMNWRGFRLSSLPPEVKERFTRVLGLVEEFWTKGGAK